MVATCPSDELTATARGKSSGGARFGRSAWLVGWLKARTTPNSTITPKIGRRVRHAGQRQGQQRGRADGRQEVGQQLDAAAVVSVRDVPGGQDQHDEGQELRERHEAEVERVAGRQEHLPADGHRQDLGGNADDEPRRQIAPQVRVAEDGGQAPGRLDRHGARA